MKLSLIQKKNRKIERSGTKIKYESSGRAFSMKNEKILFKLCIFHSTNRQRSMTRTLRSKICHRRGNWPINLWGNRHVYLLEQTSIIHIYIYIGENRVREIFLRFNKKNASSLLSQFLIFRLSEFIVSFLNQFSWSAYFRGTCRKEGRIETEQYYLLQLIFYCRGTVYGS